MIFNDIQLDALSEIINIGVGRAAKALSEMTESRIDLAVSQVQAYRTSEFGKVFGHFDSALDVMIQQGFDGVVSGRSMLAFSQDSTLELARLVGGIEVVDSALDEDIQSILEEIGNVVLNAVLGSISNVLDCDLICTLPKVFDKSVLPELGLSDEDADVSRDPLIVAANTSFKVTCSDATGSLMLVFESGDLEELLTNLILSPTT